MATALRTTPALAERGIKRLVDAGLVEETPEGLMPKFTPHIWRDREQNIEKSRENGRRNQPKVRQNSEKDRRKESKNNDSEETGGSKHCQDTTGTKSPIEGDFDPGSAGAPAEPAARPATATVPNEAPIEPQERPAWAETHKHLLMPMAQHRLPFEAWVKYVRDSGHDALADALVAERSMRTVALYPSENAALPLMLDGTSGPQVSSRLMPTVAADVDPIAAVGEHRSAVMSSEHPQGAEPGEHGDMPMAQRAGPSSLGDGEATTTARAHTNGRIPDDS